MRGGIFFTGLIILAIGVVGLFYFYSDYQNLSTPLSQVARALNPAIQQQYINLQTYIIGSIVAIILGFGLLVYGGASNLPDTEFNTVVQTTLTNLPKPKKVMTPEEEKARKESNTTSLLLFIGGIILIACGSLVNGSAVDVAPSIATIGIGIVEIIGGICVLYGSVALIENFFN